MNKGVAYLIEAFEKLEIPNKKLKLFGVISNDFQEYLRNIKLNDDIEILNPVKHNELKHIYSCSVYKNI